MDSQVSKYLVPFKVSKHSGLLRHCTKKLLATPHQMKALRQCSRAAPRSSIATVSADYLSLDLSLFIVTLDDKINLQPERIFTPRIIKFFTRQVGRHYRQGTTLQCQSKHWYRMATLYLNFTEYSRNKSEVFLRVQVDIIGKVWRWNA
jgi:hypothetical protein